LPLIATGGLVLPEALMGMVVVSLIEGAGRLVEAIMPGSCALRARRPRLIFHLRVAAWQRTQTI
jgi:hypothetical protein